MSGVLRTTAPESGGLPYPQGATAYRLGPPSLFGSFALNIPVPIYLPCTYASAHALGISRIYPDILVTGRLSINQSSVGCGSERSGLIQPIVGLYSP